MKFKEQVSISMTKTILEEARKWAGKEEIQTSTYIQRAVDLRNQWHERQEEKALKETNKLTIEEAKKLVLKDLEEECKNRTWDKDLEATMKIAKEMFNKQ